MVDVERTVTNDLERMLAEFDMSEEQRLKTAPSPTPRPSTASSSSSSSDEELLQSEETSVAKVGAVGDGLKRVPSSMSGSSQELSSIVASGGGGDNAGWISPLSPTNSSASPASLLDSGILQPGTLTSAPLQANTWGRTDSCGTGSDFGLSPASLSGILGSGGDVSPAPNGTGISPPSHDFLTQQQNMIMSGFSNSRRAPSAPQTSAPPKLNLDPTAKSILPDCDSSTFAANMAMLAQLQLQTEQQQPTQLNEPPAFYNRPRSPYNNYGSGRNTYSQQQSFEQRNGGYNMQNNGFNGRSQQQPQQPYQQQNSGYNARGMGRPQQPQQAPSAPSAAPATQLPSVTPRELLQIGQNGQNMKIRTKFGCLGSGDGQFNAPHGFCLGAMEQIIVADTNNHRIQLFAKDGSYLGEFGTAGKEEGRLWFPRKVAVIKSTGHFVICDRGNERSRMQVFDRYGNFVRRIAIRCIDIVAGLAVNRHGKIVAVDSVTPTVFVIDPKTGHLDGFFECSALMGEPSDIAVFGNEYYICDFKGHCVVVIDDERGRLIRKIGNESVTCFPNGIDISDQGDVLVGDSHGSRFHVAVFERNGSLAGEYMCPQVKVSRCCGLKISSEGYVVTLAKNNHHVLVLDTLYIG